MVSKKKSGSDVASASDAWLFLEHFTKYGSCTMAAADIDTKGQHFLLSSIFKRPELIGIYEVDSYKIKNEN